MTFSLPFLVVQIFSSPGLNEADFEKEIRPLLAENCYQCHGEKKQSGGLRLDSPTELLKGGDSGPVIQIGKPEKSLLIKAINYTGELKMPPKRQLSPKQIGSLNRWIAEGAHWPSPPSSPPDQARKAHQMSEHLGWWAFQPIKPVNPPLLKNPIGQPAEIDRFILAGLKKQGMVPAKSAETRVLIRRVTFDLTGLPPKPEDMDAFLQDKSPNRWEKLVDRLLSSPAYGQRWARHWLDVVRYADYHERNPKARNPVCEPLEAFRYRDWVVKAFNDDLPFDQFIRMQIAGDLLPSPLNQEPNVDGLIATTFLVNGAWDRGDADKEKMVSDMVDDQIDTIGKAFLGLTLGCARCHDHKFDPVTQEDYYALAGIFYSTRMLQELGTKGGEITLQRRPLVSQVVLEKRTQIASQIAELSTRIAEFDKKATKNPGDEAAKAKLLEKRDQLQKELPPEPPKALAVSEGGVPGSLFPKIQDVPIHIRGSYTRLGPVIPRGMPQFFCGKKQTRITGGSGRKELANWVASRENPLPPRVIVNRIWQWHFGTGLVRTPNNFGMLSEPPSNPELLDWLAKTFVEDGWSIKKLHKRILLSETYQQSNLVERNQTIRDPENRLLGWFPRRRLEAEEVRDSMLFISGALDPGLDGPATHDLNSNRRSLYIQTARWDRSNFSTLFDAANPDASVEKRNVSTVSPQALFLMNHDFVLSQAKQLANRVYRENPSDAKARLVRLFQLVFAREPTREEWILAEDWIGKAEKGMEREAWQDLAHMLLCSNEFIYLD